MSFYCPPLQLSGISVGKKKTVAGPLHESLSYARVQYIHF